MSLEKLVITLGLLILLCFGMYRWGHADVARIQDAWDKDREELMQANGELIAQHQKELADTVAKNKETNLENAKNHETAIEKIRADLALARAESKRLGGLRIPAPACTASNQTGPGTETNGASPLDEATARTVALPEQIEEDLWAAAGYGDEILEQARALQEWIKSQGFPVEK